MTGKRAVLVIRFIFVAKTGVVFLGLLALCAMAWAQNAVPLINNPLVPDAVAPGGGAFTLTVSGTGFVAASTVNWNGSPRATTFVSGSRLRATILASDVATASTAAVRVVNPIPGGGASNAAYFPIAVPEASVSFGRTEVPAAGGNVTVVTADFDGDGKLDLATTDYYGGVVRIFLGNGDGTFKIGPVYTSCLPHGLAAGDFNGDGIMDLAVGARGCSRVTILLGNGDGTFIESASLEVGPGGPYGAPYMLAVDDFNHDGKLDLVTANESSDVSILLGNGDGTFQEHVDYDLAGQIALHVAVGDFNGDGYLDVAVASPNQDGVTILLGNGDGTLRTGPVTPLAITDNRSLVAADLNGDGKLDLAITSSNKGTLDVMLGNGDGTFHSGGQHTVGPLVADFVAAADLNGDGVLDLAVPTYYSSSFGLLLGNGDGTFQAPVDYPAGDGARGIVVGDFNGDGRLDVAVGNQFADTISIYLQTGASGAPTSTTVLSSLNPSLRGQAVTFTATVTSTDGEIPDGERVTFYSCGKMIGTGTTSGGVATFTTSLLGVGTHSIKAAYAGDATFAPSFGTLKQVVKAITTTALISSPSASIFGQAVQLKATVTAVAAPKPTGTVTFKDGATTLGTATLNTSGVATFSTCKLSAGSHSITAIYGGGVHYRASTSAKLTQTVTKATTATTLTTSLNPSTESQAVMFTAKISSPTVTPTGTVTFTDGTTVLGKVQLSSGEAKFTTSTLAVGSTTVKATYGGCANMAGSSGSVAQEVTP
jgi:Bacterial Ig-like domain (group 3)/FG-GAP-like repeat